MNKTGGNVYPKRDAKGISFCFYRRRLWKKKHRYPFIVRKITVICKGSVKTARIYCAGGGAHRFGNENIRADTPAARRGFYQPRH